MDNRGGVQDVRSGNWVYDFSGVSMICLKVCIWQVVLLGGFFSRYDNYGA